MVILDIYALLVRFIKAKSMNDKENMDARDVLKYGQTY